MRKIGALKSGARSCFLILEGPLRDSKYSRCGYQGFVRMAARRLADQTHFAPGSRCSEKCQRARNGQWLVVSG